MNVSFYHPSENTPEDLYKDRDFAIHIMLAIQDIHNQFKKAANAKSSSTEPLKFVLPDASSGAVANL